MHRPWPHPRVLGHRGGGTLAPENTLSGFRKAAELGIGGVEFDVMLSADRVPVVIHDETLERTTDGRGEVSATPYAKLASLDAGGWFGPSFRGERLPSFELAAHLCIELGLWANVEIKPARGQDRETGSLAASAARRFWDGVSPSPLLSSFSVRALEAARVQAPDLDRGLLSDRIGSDWLESARALGCISVHCNWEHLTQTQCAEVRRAGYWLLCYTVNDPGVARRLFAWGVDAIFTDRPDLIVLGP